MLLKQDMAMPSLTQVLCAAILAVVTYHLTACGEVESAEVTALHVKEADEKKAIQPEAFFGHPIQYTATVSTRGAGEKWKTKFYVPKERK
jgi:hypothetical protein